MKFKKTFTVGDADFRGSLQISADPMALFSIRRSVAIGKIYVTKDQRLLPAANSLMRG